MPTIGVICDRDDEKGKIIHTIEMLAARNGFDCTVCSPEPKAAAEEKMDIPGKKGISGQRAASGQADILWNDITCVILDREDRDNAFRCAEILWNRAQSLLIIYVAHNVEDIVAALGMPFFHIVRRFGLEQDLEAAFRKLDKVRLSAADKVSFTQNGQSMLIPSREILYLESEHHEIRLHLTTEVLAIRENLSQCEERLKNKGFVRIYRSFLVNMYHIRLLEKENALLDNGERLYVSRRRYPEVKLVFENYIRHLDFI